MRIIILSRNIELYSTARLVEEIEKKGHEALVVDAVACSVVMEKGKPGILYHGEILHDIDAVIPQDFISKDTLKKAPFDDPLFLDEIMPF